MTSGPNAANPRTLARWQAVRAILSAIVIAAALATTAAGILALRAGRDSSSAIAGPITVVFLGIAGFVHAQRRILGLKNRRP
jgi:hypothetical protein